jgi:hypothetical protein
MNATSGLRERWCRLSEHLDEIYSAGLQDRAVG